MTTITAWVVQFNQTAQRFELINTENSKQKPFYLDFSSGKAAYRMKQGIGRNQPLPKAVGIKKDFIPTVLDVTAGLGRDSFMLASCGCQVTLLERNEIIYQLLADALQRATQTELEQIIENMQWFNIDAYSYLTELKNLPDVIYLDPMFPERNKTALVKQEMRIVRDVVGNDHDTDALFNLAMTKAKQRVVIKRHRLAPVIANKQPDFDIIGKTTRYDIYLISK